MVDILKDKCKNCKSCVYVCPFNIIYDNNGQVEVREDANPNCMDCGHCQSVCGADAILINGKLEELEKVSNNVEISDLENLVKSNRSIRNYSDKLVSEEKILEILRTVDFAPSAKNVQPTKWVVIRSKDEVKKVLNLSLEHITEQNLNPEVVQMIQNGKNPITLTASHILVAYAEKNTLNPYTDSVIKTTLASLLMHSDGIGSCFLGYLNRYMNTSEKLKNHIGMTENQQVYAVLAFGYNEKENYKNIPSRKKSDIKFI